MTIVNVKRAGYTDRTKMMGNQGTRGVVNIGRKLPTKGDCIAEKIPPTLLETKEGPAIRGKKDMVEAGIIICYRLLRISVDITGKPREKIRLEGLSIVHKFTKRSSLQRRDFESSTVKGIRTHGGDTSPTLPQREIAPVAWRSKILREMKEENCLEDIWLWKILQGGKSQSKFSPLKDPRKCRKYLKTSPPSSIQPKTSLGVSQSVCEAIEIQVSRKWWSCPAGKWCGSLKASMEGSAKVLHDIMNKIRLQMFIVGC